MSKIGLCLGGGGSRGAYQIGVGKALEELGIRARIDAFAGTSIGSVNAALLATMPAERALSLWLEASQDEIKATEGTFRRLMKERAAIVESGLYSLAPLERRLRNVLDPAVLADREVFVTVSRGGGADEHFLGLMKSVYRHVLGKEQNVLYCPLGGESLDDAVSLLLASCSIPVAFPAVVNGERRYFDGGLYDNVPVKPLADAGCDTVIAVHLFALEFVDRTRFPNVRIVELHPTSPLGWMLNFDPAKSQKLYRIGYEDTMKHFRKSPVDF